MLGGGLTRLSLLETDVAVLTIGLRHWAVVPPEEEYLENTFGDAYRRYKKAVRRWI